MHQGVVSVLTDLQSLLDCQENVSLSLSDKGGSPFYHARALSLPSPSPSLSLQGLALHHDHSP